MHAATLWCIEKPQGSADVTPGSHKGGGGNPTHGALKTAYQCHAFVRKSKEKDCGHYQT